MEKKLVVFFMVVMMLSSVSCGEKKIASNSDSPPVSYEDNQNSDTLPNTDLDTKNSDLTEEKISGFDSLKNQVVVINDVEFQIPYYFDALADDSTDSYKHYYPKVKEHYCSLVLIAQKTNNYKQSDFEESKFEITNSIIKKFANGDKFIINKSEEKTIATLSGWTSTATLMKDDKVSSTMSTSIAYDFDKRIEIIMLINIDSIDESNHDYLTDYNKILESVKILSANNQNPPSNTNGIRAEFKEAMDSYESFYNEYCDFLKKYSENPTNLELLSKYTELLSKVEDVDKKFKEWEEKDMSNEELKYYLDVNNRITKKLLEVSK